MVKFKCVITDEAGLHARPAGLLVKEAAKCTSRITVEKEGKQGDAKKIFGLMGLNVKKNDEITVIVEGEREEEEAAELKEYIANNL